MNSPNWPERRLNDRFDISAERPIYCWSADGCKYQMLVENLSADGALLICPAISGLQNGQCLRDGELALSDKNTVRLNVIVRWQLWPRIGVQFDNLSPEAARQISQLLEKIAESQSVVPK